MSHHHNQREKREERSASRIKSLNNKQNIQCRAERDITGGKYESSTTLVVFIPLRAEDAEDGDDITIVLLIIAHKNDKNESRRERR